ncbi:MAG: hypothetical protein LBN05_01240 [Oscillospiraceae bacterium]|jgi:hypothetical protein|nr:hypothetical protein [Oscillospiraceae bacterium]
MEITQISVFAENRPGRLAELTEKIASLGIDVRALSLADSTDYGVLRLIVAEPEKALASMKAVGLMATATPVLGVAVADTPGGFAQVVGVLASANISVEYAYAFLTPQTGKAGVILRVKDNTAAAAALQLAKIELLRQEQIF